MDIKTLRDALSSEISPRIDNQNYANNESKPKLASVLVLIYGEVQPNVIMVKKEKNLRIHAGEIAFPGGKWDPNDSDLLETALRETNEEICLSISREDIIGQLDSVSTLNSGFTIFPFVAIIKDIPQQLQPNPEVETILRIPLFPFLQTLAPDTNPDHNSIQEMYTLTYQGKTVWGASARILRQLVYRMSGSTGNQNIPQI